MLTTSRIHVYLSGLLMLAMALFVTVPSGFVYVFESDAQALLEGSWTNRIQWGSIYLLGLYLSWRYRAATLNFLREVNPFLLALILLMVLSAFWSPLPGVSLRRAVPMALVLLVGISAHVIGWYPQRLIRLWYIAFGLLVLASIIAALAFPSFGVHQTGAFVGQWRGIAGDKNQLAKLAGLAVVLGLHAYLTAENRRPWHALFLAMALLALIMSGGKSALVATAAAVTLMLTILRQPLSNRYWLPVTIGCVLLLVAIPLHFYSILYGIPTYQEIFGPIFEFLGKEATLTGRDDIWIWLLPIIQQHWLLGYGYGAFWVGDFGLSGEIAQALDYYPWQSHNGYIEIANELGVVGLGLALAFLALHVKQLFRLREFDAKAFGFYLPLLVLILVTNISESALFNGVNMYAVALMYASVAVSRLLMANRAQPSSVIRASDAHPESRAFVPEQAHR